MAWFIKHRTDVPEMTSIMADVPGLHPSYTPEVQHYSLPGYAARCCKMFKLLILERRWYSNVV